MPAFPVTDVPVNISQTITTSALIQNTGDDTIYLDTESSVTPYAYGTALLPRSTINWPANTVLWAVTEPGVRTSVSILYNASGSGVGTVYGDVNANITGGTINAEILGNVTVNADGSTVNIGNEVRLVGGGDLVSDAASYQSANVLLSDLIKPEFVGRKYASFRLRIHLWGGSTIRGKVRLFDPLTGFEYFTYPINYELNSHGMVMLNTAPLGFYGPLIDDPSRMQVQVAGLEDTDIAGYYLYMDYTAQTSFHLWYDNPSGAIGSLLNLGAFGTNTLNISCQIRPYSQRVIINNASAITGISGPCALYAYAPFNVLTVRTAIVNFDPSNGATLSFIVPPYTYMRLSLGSAAKTGSLNTSALPLDAGAVLL